VGKVKLIQKIDIVGDAPIVWKPILKRSMIPSEQVMLFWFFGGRLPILDSCVNKAYFGQYCSPFK
jgi:hypothetical protein